MRRIHLIDTAIASNNVGDEIIVDQARSQILPAISDAYVSSSSGHDGLGRYSRKLARASEIAFLLGTNALSARYRGPRFIWRVTWRDLRALDRKVVLVGVGANKDFDRVEARQKRLLLRLLSRNHVHSVRDSLAGKILEECGFRYINTSCPTLWRFASRQPSVRTMPSEAACFTLTWRQPHTADRQMIDALRRQYRSLAFWPQQPEDLAYLRTITDTTDIEIIAPNLTAYENHLKAVQPDVIGTRLHGGICAMSLGCRILVVAIDNRAREIGAETGLPTISRSEIDGIGTPAMIERMVPSLHVNGSRIEEFLGQFRADTGTDGSA